MARTRNFRDTVAKRARHDAAFRVALFEEALQAILDGKPEEGRGLLRDCINATLGFEALSAKAGIPVKSLMRMTGPRGNPTLQNFVVILRTLQDSAGVRALAQVYESNPDVAAGIAGFTSGGHGSGSGPTP